MPDARRIDFTLARRAETQYGVSLRGIARVIQHFLRGLDLRDRQASLQAELDLRSYGGMLGQWARRAAARMLADVSARNFRSWQEYVKEMPEALRQELRQAPTGVRLRELLGEQVSLITSLPLEAAQRVHQKALEAQTATAQRARELAQEIPAATKARAMLIARTEVARVASTLTQARAEYVGSEGYVWRTAKDNRVRESHARMEGKFVRWDTPPTLVDGTITHAGQIYNCRCYPEPVLPERIA